MMRERAGNIAVDDVVRRKVIVRMRLRKAVAHIRPFVFIRQIIRFFRFQSLVAKRNERSVKSDTET